jgi:hypothetical protein
MVLNSFIFRYFRPVFDQKLEMGFAKEMKSARRDLIFDDS